MRKNRCFQKQYRIQEEHENANKTSEFINLDDLDIQSFMKLANANANTNDTSNVSDNDSSTMNSSDNESAKSKEFSNFQSLLFEDIDENEEDLWDGIDTTDMDIQDDDNDDHDDENDHDNNDENLLDYNALFENDEMLSNIINDSEFDTNDEELLELQMDMIDDRLNDIKEEMMKKMKDQVKKKVKVKVRESHPKQAELQTEIAE